MGNKSVAWKCSFISNTQSVLYVYNEFGAQRDLVAAVRCKLNQLIIIRNVLLQRYKTNMETVLNSN